MMRAGASGGKSASGAAAASIGIVAIVACPGNGGSAATWRLKAFERPRREEALGDLVYGSSAARLLGTGVSPIPAGAIEVTVP